MKRNVLIATSMLFEQDKKRIAEFANIITLDDIEKDDKLLPYIDAMIIARWPSMIDGKRLQKMQSLKMIQCIFAGVDNLPFADIPSNVIICSNAGAYSLEVAEHAAALMLSASHHAGRFQPARNISGQLDQYILSSLRMIYGKKIGIVGYGGIGRAFASLLKGFNPTFLAYSRRKYDKDPEDSSIEILNGREGLDRLLQESDAILLSIPLTKETKYFIGKKELSMMKEDCILVNVARGDIVEPHAIAEHLRLHQNFIYASDVGWIVNGTESMDPYGELSGLKNYLTTPHIAGLLSTKTGRPSKLAADNVIRFLSGENPENQVNRQDYI